jgi:hypothetical protein
MYDLAAEMYRFYDEEVRLKKPDRDALAGYRDLNLSRLNSGLEALKEERGTPHPPYASYRNQGSYAMGTLNKHADGDYDIDVAVVFRKEHIPDSPADARKRVRDALLKKCTNFAKEPEARTNAVTIWYAEGYHVDFAVYRTSTDFWGETVVEHASGDEWKPRDPDAVTSWFEGAVTSRSPGNYLDQLFRTEVTVHPGQLRRVVALLKAFCKSRSGWSLPGGMIISALAGEAYQGDRNRDDVALHATMVAIHDRLKRHCAVYNPVNPAEELTAKPRRKSQVERLLPRLEKALEDLEVLHQPDCTVADARAAWKAVFNHTFWGPLKEENRRVEAAAAPGVVSVECGMASVRDGRPYRMYLSDGAPIPRGVHLRFRVTRTSVAAPYAVRWTVKNEGDEAGEGNNMSHTHETSHHDTTYWTSSAYKGRHEMICEVLKDGRVVARTVHVVRVKATGRRA